MSTNNIDTFGFYLPVCCITRRGLVICKDLNHTEWIYVIKSGSCRVLTTLHATKAHLPKPCGNRQQELIGKSFKVGMSLFDTFEKHYLSILSIAAIILSIAINYIIQSGYLKSQPVTSMMRKRKRSSRKSRPKIQVTGQRTSHGNSTSINIIRVLKTLCYNLLDYAS